jgi:hypothetical protein
VHIIIKDGCTVVQHRRILDKIEQCLDTDPEESLQEHKHLLSTNFKKLAAGPVKDKQQWVAEFETARSAACHIGKGSRVVLRTRYSRAKYPRLQMVFETVQVEKEGSLRWRCQMRI